MNADLELRNTDLTSETKTRILAVKEHLQTMSPEELHGAIIWAEAVAAAGKAKRAWEVAKEAAELLICAQRELGEFFIGGMYEEAEATLRFKEQSSGRPREINQDTVDEIQEMFRDGKNIKQIADELNRRGVPTPRGGRWHSPGVKRAIEWGESKSTMIDPKEQGAYIAVALIPDELFKSVVHDLLDRGKSVDPRTVLRVSRLRSMEHVEPGIHRSWDGIFFTTSSKRTAYGGYRRSKKTTIDEVRQELYEEERLLDPKKPKAGPSKMIDAAFAEARRDAQALNDLRSSQGIWPDVRDIIAQAELLQGKVASLLFEAYRQNEIMGKEHRKMIRRVNIPKRVGE